MRIIKFFLIVLVASMSFILKAQPMTDAEWIEAIREHPYRALGNQCPYISPGVIDTPAPSGYKPFYVSHLGRHGSRYDIRSKEKYIKALALLDTLYYNNLLTPYGDSLRTEIRHISQVYNDGADGMLTDRGTLEHATIAANLCKRVPELFHQPERRKVQCTATMVARTIQSMAGFCTSIARFNNGLEIDIRSRNGLGINNQTFYADPNLKVMSSKENSELRSALLKKFVPGEDKISSLKSRLFKDPSRVSSKEMLNIFLSCSTAYCLDIDVDPLRFFTPEELFEYSKYREAYSCYSYGTIQTNATYKNAGGCSMAQLILDDADAAIQGNGRCADFRFAHDGNIAPLMFLLGIGPYSYVADEEEPYRNFQGFRSICMASNLQLIFYRSDDDSEVLVKPIFNELEVTVPGLKPVSRFYYKWSELRRYIVSKVYRINELPDYYTDYLKQKSKEIAKLQKDELDGFIFITDMHFPSNFGRASGMMESLSKMVPLNRIVFGGDALTYLDKIEDGMFGQISAFEQMKGAAPLYWVRGNHDVVNYTGRKPGITADRKALEQWDVCTLMTKFRGSDAMTDNENRESAYYYYDSKVAKIRYLVFDTTDSVRDNNMVTGVSSPQLRFLADAGLKVPQGWKIVYISHIPIFDKYAKKHQASMEGAMSLVEAMEKHLPFRVGDEMYDFSKRPDIELICGLCGHRHRDYSTETPGGAIQLNFDSDCNYVRKDVAGSLCEQSFNYVSIAKDGHTIRVIRLGNGENRTYSR